MKKVIILLIAALFIFAACTPAGKEAVNTSPKQEEKTAEKTSDATTIEPLPMKVAVVVALDRYAPTELHPIMDALITAGYDPVVASSEAGTAEAQTETMQVNAAFTEFTAADLRGIVLIGGSDSLWENAELHTLLQDCRDNGRVTAAICLASVTLAKAGIIGEGDSACWFNCDIADPEMQAAGVLDSGLPVTVDGLIITGDGPDSAEEFAGEVVKALDGIG